MAWSKHISHSHGLQLHTYSNSQGGTFSIGLELRTAPLTFPYLLTTEWMAEVGKQSLGVSFETPAVPE